MSTHAVRTYALLLSVASLTLPAGVQAQKKQRDLITREEIQKSAQVDGDLYSAIRALRPQFLEPPRGSRTLGNSSMAPLAVYVGKVRQSGMDALQSIMANTVAEVRYLDPARSENEFGITSNGGALIIKLYVAPTPADSAKKPH